MIKAEGIIFDMDGTLYPFSDGLPFERNSFGATITANTQKFFTKTLNLTLTEIRELKETIARDFAGETSIGLEKLKAIPRKDFFEATWCMSAADYVKPTPGLISSLESIDTPMAILSAAPDIWLQAVVKHLSIEAIFGDAIFSGEPDIRKPNPEAFKQIADFWEVDPRRLVAIGDQELTDIVPARRLGMFTVLISANRQHSQADLVVPTIHEAISRLQQGGVV